jgi:hypothetical protein
VTWHAPCYFADGENLDGENAIASLLPRVNRKEDEMATEWFCRIMGAEWGPMSAMELVAVARRGRLSRDDLVRRGDHDTWVRAELVRGLFNGPPVATTVTSDRLAVDARQASPAKRSMRQRAGAQYWIKADARIAGPFTSQTVREMAERGTLKPSHSISKDRVRWGKAALVEGLSFGNAKPDAPTASVRSAVWLDGSADFAQQPTASLASSEANEPVLLAFGR